MSEQLTGKSEPLDAQLDQILRDSGYTLSLALKLRDKFLNQGQEDGEPRPEPYFSFIDKPHYISQNLKAIEKTLHELHTMFFSPACPPVTTIEFSKAKGLR